MSDQQFRPAHSAFDESPEVKEAAALSLAGKRLDRAAAEALYYGASLHTLAQLAHAMRLRLHPEPIVTYVGDRNINYSNVCVCACRFCAFFRAPESGEGYVITREEMARKIDETLRLGGTQILLQGGHHPDLPLEWYEDLLRWMRATWPSLHIHAFSPPEIFFWSQKFGLSVDEVISRLKAAGLDSIPGGGAEILQNDVRAQVSPNKCSADQWLYVMERAHNLGMRTTATMMFGHEEEPRHRLDHLFAVREVQDPRLHRLHPLDLPARPYPHQRDGPPARARLSAPAGRVAPGAGQYPQHPVLLGDHGARSGPAGPLLRCQRLRLAHDRGERGGRRRRVLPPDPS